MWWGDVTYSIAFYLTAAIAIAAAFMVVWHKNPVINALYLVVCFFAVAVCYVFLNAHFLAAIQVLLYAGAVLVLFLMIIMLLNLDARSMGMARPTLGKAIGGAAVFGLVLIMASGLVGFKTLNRPGEATAWEIALLLKGMGEDPAKFQSVTAPKGVMNTMLTDKEMLKVTRSLLVTYADPEVKDATELPEDFRKLKDNQIEGLRLGLLDVSKHLEGLSLIRPPVGFEEHEQSGMFDFIRAVAWSRFNHLQEFGSTASVGRILFSRYLLPFEAASVLLLAAIIGVMVLARKGTGEESS